MHPAIPCQTLTSRSKHAALRTQQLPALDLFKLAPSTWASACSSAGSIMSLHPAEALLAPWYQGRPPVRLRPQRRLLPAWLAWLLLVLGPLPYVQLVYGACVHMSIPAQRGVQVCPPPLQKVLCDDAEPWRPAQTAVRLHHVPQLRQRHVPRVLHSAKGGGAEVKAMRASSGGGLRGNTRHSG
jgi:hypothetical protein